MRLFIIILIVALPNTGHTQDLVSVANSLLNDKNYLEAKSTIDDAFQNADLSQNSRAWFTKGRIYHEILKSKDTSLNSVKKDLIDFTEEVVLCYNKTKGLTQPGSNLFILASNQLEVLWAEAINAGYADFQTQAFDAATRAFEMAQVAKPQDTIAYLYAGFSAQNAGNYNGAVKHYTALKRIAPLSKTVYNNLIVCAQAMNAPLNERLDIIEEAIFNYPDHLPYIAEEVRALVKLRKYEEAESRLNTVLKRFQNNYELRLRRADLFDIIFKEAYASGLPERSERYFEMATDDYEMYLNKYPQDFTANYNYSVMINEQANRIYDRVNLMNDEEYQISGKETEELGHQWTRKALPYMEKAHALKPKDELVIKALRVYYERLKMQDKLNKLNGN